MIAAHSVIVEPKFETAHEGKDIGCTFFRITCENCKAKVGRVYKTTSVALDRLREAFTFDMNALTRFEIMFVRELTHAAISLEAGHKRKLTLGRLQQLCKQKSSRYWYVDVLLNFVATATDAGVS